MTIWRAPDGRLVLYSVIAMHEEGMAALEGLGQPAFMVIPHLRHHMDAPFYKRRYPGIRVLAETPTPANGVNIDGPIKELESLGVGAEIIPGTGYQDIALDLPLPDGRALCVCELLSNVAPPTGLARLAYHLLGPPGGGFGVARAVRVREVRDKPTVRVWLSRQATRTDLRLLVVGHGQPLMGGVSAALARAATQV